MNKLGTSAADNKRYDELKAIQHDAYHEAVPSLIKALEIDSKNIGVAKTLMSIYSILSETAKFNDMKKIVEELEASEN